MAIVGERPESGVRVAIERPKTAESPPWTYEGAVHVPEASYPARVAVTGDGRVTVTLSPSEGGAVPPADLEEKVRLVVRTAYRQAAADGEPPAWRIVRWRGSW